MVQIFHCFLEDLSLQDWPKLGLEISNCQFRGCVKGGQVVMPFTFFREQYFMHAGYIP